MSKLTPGWQKSSVLETVFDQLSDALVLYDPEFRITGVNRSAEKLIGHAESETLDHPLSDVLPELDEMKRASVQSMPLDNLSDEAGAHLLRNGAGLILGRMMAEGWLTHLATNGAGTTTSTTSSERGCSQENESACERCGA